jgi:hypothetical protein
MKLKALSATFTKFLLLLALGCLLVHCAQSSGSGNSLESEDDGGGGETQESTSNEIDLEEGLEKAGILERCAVYIGLLLMIAVKFPVWN